MSTEIIFLILGLAAMLREAVLNERLGQFMKISFFVFGIALFMMSYDTLFCKDTGAPIQFSELKEDWRYKRELPEAILVSTYNENGYSRELTILLPPQGIPKEYFPIGKPFVRNGQNLHFPED
ncbi:hypothetical protein KAU19_08045 [Candidatus Parcubacteria bacterium]|nr:hypothetical protein [Candidatus Parcubacteria bacterium]